MWSDRPSSRRFLPRDGHRKSKNPPPEVARRGSLAGVEAQHGALRRVEGRLHGPRGGGAGDPRLQDRLAPAAHQLPHLRLSQCIRVAGAPLKPQIDHTPARPHTSTPSDPRPATKARAQTDPRSTKIHPRAERLRIDTKSAQARHRLDPEPPQAPDRCRIGPRMIPNRTGISPNTDQISTPAQHQSRPKIGPGSTPDRPPKTAQDPPQIDPTSTACTDNWGLRP